MLYAPGRAGSLGGSVKAGVRRQTTVGISSAATFSVASQLQLATAAFFIGVGGMGEESGRFAKETSARQQAA